MDRSALALKSRQWVDMGSAVRLSEYKGEIRMGQYVELILDGIAHGGEALGRAEGKVVFVSGAIPGERVRVEVLEEKQRWARARLIEVLDASSDRVDPPCPYFGADLCGGCQWQHIAYERQVELKADIVRDQLRRLGGMNEPPVADPVALADDEGVVAYGYRNHAQFTTTPEGALGFLRADSHDVIPVDHCLLLHEDLDVLHAALDVAWPELTGIALRAGINTGEAMIIFESSGGEQPELELDLPAACVMRTPQGIQPLIGEPWLNEEVDGQVFRVSANSFFQVNTLGAQALVDVVTTYLEASPTDILLDAYCGVGLFALSLADAVAEVIGIESSPSACEDFAQNAGERQNVALHEGSVDAVLSALIEQGQQVDLVVLDPPRSGAGHDVLRGLAELQPRTIVYVSCDPATLARDLSHLTEVGYRMMEVQPVDMFPQTYHIECVARFERETANVAG